MLNIDYENSSFVAWTVPTDVQVGPFSVTGRWNRNVGTTFTSSDIGVSLGTIDSFSYVSSTRHFGFRVIPPGDVSGFITISILANRVTPANTFQSVNVEIGAGPVVTWLTVPTTQQTGPFAITGRWSRTVTNFTISDINVNVGTVDSFSYVSSTRDFGFRVTPPTSSSGTITITIPANSVTPANTVQIISVAYEDIGPVVTWTVPTLSLIHI